MFVSRNKDEKENRNFEMTDKFKIMMRTLEDKYQKDSVFDKRV